MFHIKFIMVLNLFIVVIIAELKRFSIGKSSTFCLNRALNHNDGKLAILNNSIKPIKANLAECQ